MYETEAATRLKPKKQEPGADEEHDQQQEAQREKLSDE